MGTTDPNGGFEVIKLPADVSLEEAGLMYVQGIDKLSAGDAVKLFEGILDAHRLAQGGRRHAPALR